MLITWLPVRRRCCWTSSTQVIMSHFVGIFVVTCISVVCMYIVVSASCGEGANINLLSTKCWHPAKKRRNKFMLQSDMLSKTVMFQKENHWVESPCWPPCWNFPVNEYVDILHVEVDSVDIEHVVNLCWHHGSKRNVCLCVYATHDVRTLYTRPHVNTL